MTTYKSTSLLAIGALALVGYSVTPAAAQLIITPTFDSSITGDANFAAIESTINSAIHVYETTFTNPINVTIDFKEMASGLGESEWNYYNVNYANFIQSLRTNAAASGDANQLAAISLLPQQTNNPVTGSTTINVKPANLFALGVPSFVPPIGFDGIISLNTSITTPGSPGSSLQYSLMSVTEHEIDEVLGLGSAAGGGFLNNDPLPEDLFRYDQNGIRSYTSNSSSLAFFSIDGTTDLAQFDNQNDGGDFGDWQSNPRPGGVNPQVQDAFATPGSNPALGPNEIEALNVIGYNLAQIGPPNAAPEPGSLALLVSIGLVGAGTVIRRVSRRKNS